MPNNNNMSDEDYLDSLLRAVSPAKDDFDIDKELGLDDELNAEFEAEFEAQLKAEFEAQAIEIESKNDKNTMAASNSVFTDDEKDPEVKDIEDNFIGDVSKIFGVEQEETEMMNETADEPEFAEQNFATTESEFTETTSYDDEAMSNDYAESMDITDGLESILGTREDTPAEPAVDKKAEIKAAKAARKAEDKAAKARIKANRKAAKEAAKIAKIAERAELKERKAREKASKESVDFMDSMEDVLASANSDLRKEYEENPALGRTAEEKYIDDSVDEAMADLGLDALFSAMGEDLSVAEEKRSKRVYEETPEDDVSDPFAAEEKEEPAKPKKEKKKKEPKPKKVKPKKVKPKKPPKQKKAKLPDEIVPIPWGLLGLGLSVTVLLVAAVTIGGDYYHYEKAMGRAVAYYIDKDYQSAYREISGLDIKEKDQFFYEQVKVVMTVESNYDMFKSMMRIGSYTEALDLLLKGVENFDLYQNDAREWEAFDDLEVSLRRVVDALNKYYGITESQAREINLIESRREYTSKVAELAKNVMYDKEVPFDDETTTAIENESTESSETETTVNDSDN